MRAARRRFASVLLVALPFTAWAQEAKTFEGAATPKEAFDRLRRGALKEDVEMVASVLAQEDRGVLLTPLVIAAHALAEGVVEGEAGNPAAAEKLNLLLEVMVAGAAKANPVDPSSLQSLDDGQQLVFLIAHGVTHLSHEEGLVLARAIGETLRPIRNLLKDAAWRPIQRVVPAGRFVLSEQKGDTATATAAGRLLRFVRHDGRWLVAGLASKEELAKIVVPHGSVRIGKD